MRVLAETQRGRVSRDTITRAVLPKVWLSWLFEPRDIYVGVYLTKPDTGWRHAVDVYVCVVPMLPVRVSVRHVSFAQLRHDVRRAASRFFA